ncbi:MAG TPA: hypothetical protein VII92_02630 [Anaerolineae bacterium]
MFYVSDQPGGQHLVSIKTGKRYYFRGPIEGDDYVRAARELERDDTPPEPAPEPVRIVPVKPRPFDHGAQTRIQLDEMKLQQMRCK